MKTEEQINEIENQLVQINQTENILNETMDDTAELLRSWCINENERLSSLHHKLCEILRKYRKIITSEENGFREIESYDEYDDIDYTTKSYTNNRIIIRYHFDEDKIKIGLYKSPVLKYKFTIPLDPSINLANIDYSASLEILRKKGIKCCAIYWMKVQNQLKRKNELIDFYASEIRNILNNELKNQQKLSEAIFNAQLNC